MRSPLLAFWFVLVAAASASSAEPVRLAADAFGTQAEVEIRDLPRAQATEAARDALREIYQVSQLADPAGDAPGGFGALNAAAGDGPVLLEARVGDLLRRGLQYCLWTNGAHGPLGGGLYRLWRDLEAPRLPDPSALRAAVNSAGCEQISLRSGDAGLSAQIGAGSRVAAVGMGRGFALDRAATVLRSAGAENAWLEIGNVYRAIGRGPEGKGWLATLPAVPGMTRPPDQVWLRDQALAVATLGAVGGDPGVRYIDQRTGVPARGVVMVATVTREALDAEALAATLFVNGLREGHMRLGSLDPRPSVFWLLGEGKGEPLESTYRWSELERRRN